MRRNGLPSTYTALSSQGLLRANAAAGGIAAALCVAACSSADVERLAHDQIEPGAASETRTTARKQPLLEASGGADTTWVPQDVVAINTRIPLAGGWTTDAQWVAPRGPGPFPGVVLVHGSGLNDMDETLPTPDGGVATFFRPITRAVAESGIAVLRYNKRGVLSVGPEPLIDEAFAHPADPDTAYTIDAADVATFAANLDLVDEQRVFLLGHSEGTLNAANIAGGHITASNGRTPRVAGVVTMGVVGLPLREILYYQLIQRNLDALLQFDQDGDGLLTLSEAQALPADTQSQVLTEGHFADGLDANRDGKLNVTAEVEPALRADTNWDDYPNIKAGEPDPDLVRLIVSLEVNGTVTERLPAYRGPVLLMNGRNDSQTVTRNAEVADAALARSGHPDHTLKLYEGLGHTFNETGIYEGAFGEPVPEVVRDLASWLKQKARL
jgi:uncharacterized protein